MNSIRNRAFVSFLLLYLSLICGIQLIGSTEATFTSETDLEPIAISTLFVFPATILELEQEANRITEKIEVHYQQILDTKTVIPATSEEIKQTLELLYLKTEKLNEEILHLEAIKNELANYHSNIPTESEKDTYAFITEVLSNVEKEFYKISESVDFAKINQSIQAFEIAKRETEEKEELSSTIQKETTDEFIVDEEVQLEKQELQLNEAKETLEEEIHIEEGSFNEQSIDDEEVLEDEIHIENDS